VLLVENIKEYDCASAITAAETGSTEVYRDLLNVLASLDIANNAFCS
jgi:hypothetical protein